MTRRRWIADEVSGNYASLVGSHAEHLSRVLRARPGQEFDISTPDGLRRGRIVEVTDARVDFQLGEEVPAATAADVTVLLSIFKFDRMEWAIEKCTELGAARIVPVIAQRTEKHLAAAALKRWERWQRLTQQAAEQSRRLKSPSINPPMTLKEAVALSSGKKIVLSEVEQDVMLKDVVAGSSSVALAFGPEGGWTESELKLFLDLGWISVSLGDTILRAETAAIAGLAIALAVMAPCTSE
jgi:16S rRNA (uracil1498-N3)-methyltransferase